MCPPSVIVCQLRAKADYHLAFLWSLVAGMSMHDGKEKEVVKGESKLRNIWSNSYDSRVLKMWLGGLLFRRYAWKIYSIRLQEDESFHCLMDFRRRCNKFWEVYPVVMAFLCFHPELTHFAWQVG